MHPGARFFAGALIALAVSGVFSLWELGRTLFGFDERELEEEHEPTDG